MDAMTHPNQLQATGPRTMRAPFLLVLAVLAGIVAMHGLTPDVMPAAHMMPAATMSPAARAPAMSASCTHAVRSGGPADGHHSSHADTTCAAAGTAGGPALRALTPALGVAAEPPVSAGAVEPATGGRAPPDLAELQLLRI
jgi:hypothetical protein